MFNRAPFLLVDRQRQRRRGPERVTRGARHSRRRLRPRGQRESPCAHFRAPALRVPLGRGRDAQHRRWLCARSRHGRTRRRLHLLAYSLLWTTTQEHTSISRIKRQQHQMVYFEARDEYRALVVDSERMGLVSTWFGIHANNGIFIRCFAIDLTTKWSVRLIVAVEDLNAHVHFRPQISTSKRIFCFSEQKKIQKTLKPHPPSIKGLSM